MLEELYIGGKQVDVKDTSIVRSYKTPYFSDVESLLSDSTYTIKLPPTERNKAVMQYLHEADMNTDFPYTYHYADYIVEGMQIIRNGEVKVLGDFEIQIVYGVNREKYLPLKVVKLNEIPFDSNITESKWVFDFYRPSTDKKYNIFEYISLLRKSDKEIIGGVYQPTLQPPAPFDNGIAKLMTLHPFIYANDIIELIYTYLGLTGTELSELKSRLINKGLLLSGNKDNNDYEYRYQYTGTNETSSKLHLSYAGSDDYLLSISHDTFKLQPNSYIDFELNIIISLNLNISVSAITGMQLWKKELSSGAESKVQDIVCVVSDYDTTVNQAISLLIEKGFEYYFKFTGSVPASNTVLIGSSINIKSKILYSVFSTNNISGRYNCIPNLPNILLIEFIQQMLIHTCGFLGTDINGDLKISFLDDFKANLDNGYDWSGKISNVRNSKYQFNSNAQNNWIKFNNDKDLIDRKESIVVSDETIVPERYLYTMEFDSPFGGDGEMSEYILYEQSVKRTGTDGVSFENKYVGDKYKPAFVKNDSGVLKNINIIDKHIIINEDAYYTTFNGACGSYRNEWICSGISGYLSSYDIHVGDKLYSLDGIIYTELATVIEIIDSEDKIVFSRDIFDSQSTIIITNNISENIISNYSIYQKLINRPIVKEVDVLLDFYESANIDFTKPIYIKEWGKYCMLLELTAPNKGLCEAKLLLINQTL